MRIALAGKPGAGKSSLFDLFEGKRNSEGVTPSGLRIAHVDVPDDRLYKLAVAFKPKKTTPARLEFQELEQKSGPTYPALSPERREMLTKCDMVLLVVDLFSCDPDEWVKSAQKQVGQVVEEFALLDLATVESRLERLRKLLKIGQKPAFPSELEVLETLHAGLQEGRPVRDHEIVRGLSKELGGFGFLSELEILPAFNVGEGHLDARESLDAPPIRALAGATGASTPSIVFCAEVEHQIQELPAEERGSFMEMFGLREPAVAQTIRAAYERVGLYSFFTVGPDEVRAWSVRKGSTAPQAAGAIHSDLEKGFVRAEVVSYADWAAAAASQPAQAMNVVKEKGHFRLEGKDYVVADGDILNIRSGLAKSRG